MSLIHKSLLSLFSSFLLSSFSSSLGFWEEGRWPRREYLTFESEMLGLKCWIHTILADGPPASVCWPSWTEGWENALERGKKEGWCGGAVSLPGCQLEGVGEGALSLQCPRGSLQTSPLVGTWQLLSPGFLLCWGSPDWRAVLLVRKQLLRQTDMRTWCSPVEWVTEDSSAFVLSSPLLAPFISYSGILGATVDQESHVSLCWVSAETFWLISSLWS